jgi:osmoprotectant transport system substrate-binding protein
MGVRGTRERPGRQAWWVLLSATLLLLGACSTDEPSSTPPGGDELVVASFNFDESRLLAEIYALALEDEGIPVRRELDLGPREVVLPALRQGHVDVVPEYLGTILDAVARGPHGDERDPTVLRGLLDAVLEPWGLSALAPSSASNQNAVVVTRATAEARGLRTISDLEAVAPRLTLGGPPECPLRERCLLGLEETYSLAFDGFLPFDGARLVRQALLDGIVDVGVLFTTDGHLAGDELVTLRDDRGLQPAENVIPVVRTAAVASTRAGAVLDEVAAELTTEQLRFLNWRVSVAGGSPAAEARGWLIRHGLVDR